MENQRVVVAKLNKEQLEAMEATLRNTKIAREAFKEASRLIYEANEELGGRLRTMFPIIENWDGLIFNDLTGEITRKEE